MLVVVRGAGDLASGIAVRLHAANWQVVMLERAYPTSIRRGVCFSEAVRLGEAQVEGVRGRLAADGDEAVARARSGECVSVLVDPDGESIERIAPDAVVDAILAKRNVGTRIDMAPVVVGVGPGFEAGVDCHAAIETMRGHDLGRVLYRGCPAPDTGIPGTIGGYARERVLRAPAEGAFRGVACIGDVLHAGDVVAYAGGEPVATAIGGVLRGILQDSPFVPVGMKVADVDPRGVRAHCWSVSDKARAIGGGALEAIMHCSAEAARSR